MRAVICLLAVLFLAVARSAPNASANSPFGPTVRPTSWASVALLEPGLQGAHRGARKTGVGTARSAPLPTLRSASVNRTSVGAAALTSPDGDAVGSHGT